MTDLNRDHTDKVIKEWVARRQLHDHCDALHGLRAAAFKKLQQRIRYNDKLRKELAQLKSTQRRRAALQCVSK